MAEVQPAEGLDDLDWAQKQPLRHRLLPELELQALPQSRPGEGGGVAEQGAGRGEAAAPRVRALREPSASWWRALAPDPWQRRVSSVGAQRPSPRGAGDAPDALLPGQPDAAAGSSLEPARHHHQQQQQQPQCGPVEEAGAPAGAAAEDSSPAGRDSASGSSGAGGLAGALWPASAAAGFTTAVAANASHAAAATWRGLGLAGAGPGQRGIATAPRSSTTAVLAAVGAVGGGVVAGPWGMGLGAKVGVACALAGGASLAGGRQLLLLRSSAPNAAQPLGPEAGGDASAGDPGEGGEALPVSTAAEALQSPRGEQALRPASHDAQGTGPGPERST